MNTETIEYKNYIINIEQDTCPQNPFEDWDCLPALFVLYDRDIKGYANTSNFDVDYLPALNREEIKENADTLRILLDSGYSSLSRLLLNERENYNHICAVDLINELLQDLYDSINNSDKLALYSDILKIKKVNHLLTSSQGYSQGDYVDLLIIADDAYYKTTGANRDDTLVYYADIYGAWAWGDVYGYTVTDKAGKEIDESCWGFYGVDHEKSGLLECAKNTIDCEIKHNRKQKLAKLKVLIKNRVSIDLRESLLV